MALLIFISLLDIEKVNVSLSASVAVTVPIVVWFSSALKTVLDVKLGAALFITVNKGDELSCAALS